VLSPPPHLPGWKTFHLEPCISEAQYYKEMSPPPPPPSPRPVGGSPPIAVKASPPPPIKILPRFTPPSPSPPEFMPPSPSPPSAKSTELLSGSLTGAHVDPKNRHALNCDGTVHVKGDGKPMKRTAYPKKFGLLHNSP